MKSSFASAQSCQGSVTQPFPYSMAFQPIVDVVTGQIYAYEALVRGVQNESAASVLAQVTPQNRYAFDQGCRVAAIRLAKRLGLDQTPAKLSINFLPGVIDSPSGGLQLTLATAREVGFPLDRLIFEITESEEVKDRAQLLAIFTEYRRRGFQMAMDDFGAGFCGLNLFADLTPDILKVDMELTRNLHERPVAQATMRFLVELAASLDIPLIGEGVESIEEYDALRRSGVRLMQGYLLGRPAFEALPDFTLPCSLADGSPEDGMTPIAERGGTTGAKAQPHAA
jgi:EAL domain-containing protein (putative c-di-GMP-specific phosphodiesterase class I)